MSADKSHLRGGGRPDLYSRQSSTLHYQTFPHAPPRNPGPRQSSRRDVKSNGSRGSLTPASENPPSPHRHPSRSREGHGHGSGRGEHDETPLPKGQMAILAVIALAEQTALNSISPYIPQMVATFPEVGANQVGLYVGLIASSFALAQFTTNFLWGWLSDRIGRKPVVLTGTFLTACCFVGFGFSRRLWHALVAQALMGLVNGNQGVISTCLGEITDRTNQSRAFTYLPVIYGLGGITGPIVGGSLVMRQNPLHPGQDSAYPYLLPNLFSAGILIVDMVLTIFFLKESLECAQDLPPLGKRIGNLFAWMWQFTSSHRPTYLRRSAKGNGKHKKSRNGTSEQSPLLEEGEDHSDDGSTSELDGSHPNLLPEHKEHLSFRDVLNRDTVLLLATFFLFQLSNISYNSLYPVFAQTSPPAGRSLTPKEIGISLAFAGAITIVFQVGIFGRLRERIGNRITYRTSLAGFVLAFILMPFVGYKSGSATHPTNPPTTRGKVLLAIELAAVLIIKTISAVGGLTSALLLITNSAPSHAVLGTLNGLAQTLSAAGRAVGPLISGGLFSFATERIRGKGGWEGSVVAWGVFAGLSLVGCGLAIGIRGAELEAEGWEDDTGDEEEGREGDSEGR